MPRAKPGRKSCKPQVRDQFSLDSVIIERWSAPLFRSLVPGDALALWSVTSTVTVAMFMNA